jgi:hypothetical protein
LGSAAFLLFLGVFICWEGRKLEYGRILKPGPAFFPFWLGVAPIIFSAALVFQIAREKIGRSVSSPE